MKSDSELACAGQLRQAQETRTEKTEKDTSQ